MASVDQEISQQPDWFLASIDQGHGDVVALRGVDLTAAVASMSMQWAIGGPDGGGVPTVKMDIADQDHVLLTSADGTKVVLDANEDGRIDGGVYVLVGEDEYVLSGVERTATGQTLTFAHWIAFTLDQDDDYKTSAALTESRAQFIGKLVQANKGFLGHKFVPYSIPEWTQAQAAGPALTSTNSRTHAAQSAARVDSRAKGFAPDAKVPLSKGVYCSKEQLKILSVTLDMCDRLKAGERASIAIIETLIAEDGIQNIVDKVKDHGSIGAFQLTPDTAKGMKIDPLNVAACANAFLLKGFTSNPEGGAIAIARKHPEYSTGLIAEKCQGSKFADGSNYNQYLGVAQTILKAWGGATGTLKESELAGTGSANSGTSTVNNTLTRGTPQQKEGTYTCAGRLADEVQRRRFIAQGRFFYISDNKLMKSAPAVTISADHEAVESMSWIADDRALVRRMKVQVRATVDTLLAMAGRVVVVDGEGAIAEGVGGHGKWLVTALSMDVIGSNEGTIELSQPKSALAEPRSLANDGGQAATVASSDAAKAKKVADSSTAINGSTVTRMRRRANQIDKKKWLYSWGGGHDSGFTGPYDCSGGVSAVLHAGGLLSSPETTVGLKDWGDPGEGNAFTVYVHETGNPHESHTFIVFKSSTGKDRIWECGGITGAYSGWRPNETVKSHTDRGFKPRHWKNL